MWESNKKTIYVTLTLRCALLRILNKFTQTYYTSKDFLTARGTSTGPSMVVLRSLIPGKEAAEDWAGN